MFKNRFTINSLSFEGSRKKQVLNLFDGLNIIYGPSNTGKSLIVEFINYVFGSDNYEDFYEVNEINQYNVVILEITDKYNKTYSITRDLHNPDSDIWVSGDNFLRAFRPKFRTSEKNIISDFLLKITSATDLKIIKNASFEKKNYTFFYQRLTSIIDEDKIISKKYSPFLSGQNYDKTKEISAFKVMITDTDYSDVPDIDKKAMTKSKIDAQKDFIDNLKDEVNNQIIELNKNFDKNQYYILKNAIEKFNNMIDDFNTKINSLYHNRDSFEKELDKYKSKLIFTEELINRFILHKKFLESDKERLNFIIEGNLYLDRLLDHNCPICNSNIDINLILANTDSSIIDLEKIKSAYKAEMSKILYQLTDIELSIENEEKELEHINSIIFELDENIDFLNAELKSFNENKMKIHEMNMESFNELERIKSIIEDKQSMLENLNIKLSNLNKMKPSSKITYSKDISDEDSLTLSQNIQNILEGFDYDKEYGRINEILFDIDKLDIKINNKSRTSNGKGVRALIASCMAIALMKFAIDNDKIHPGFVILDSPLLSFKEREKTDKSEIINEKVQDMFFKYLSTFTGMQIIVLENTTPPEKLNANLIHFTGTEIDRNGLL
ncbi:hypothetical protein [Clostridium intestinale]|uniref:AAA domain-containing protein n=1 Tax=Clostridium intestinale DSM 6191 TaxID=1121320 RepID=A0A1M5TDH7_9CLOT|nr:hypothetical protein [Clostridium intestinale]SHH48670.1 hypothetical protein SAMN02745941_00175 [Clostridium intestinale DSM 6191]